MPPGGRFATLFEARWLAARTALDVDASRAARKGRWRPIPMAWPRRGPWQPWPRRTIRGMAAAASLRPAPCRERDAFRAALEGMTPRQLRQAAHRAPR